MATRPAPLRAPTASHSLSRGRCPLLLSLAVCAGAGHLLAPAPLSARTETAAQAGAGDSGPVDTRIKIVPKPVPCVPCPCECPDPRTVAAMQYSSQPGAIPPHLQSGPEEPARTAPEPPPEGRVRHRPGEVPGEARPVPPPPPPRGTILGEVTVRDRSGKERGDRSDVVVYIEKMPRRFAALKRTRHMAQRDKSFTPRVLAVTRGSTVEFPNEDKFFHNVFSLSEGNVFDLGLYRAGTSKSVTFEKTGVVDVYCNIHPNMWAQILVLDNPFYSITGKEGIFELPKVPPGSYAVVAWVSGGEPVRQQVRVEPGGKASLRFELREGSSSKPHLNKFNEPYGRYTK